MDEIVYLGLGGNVGETARILGEVVSRLSTQLSTVRVSPVYRTSPIGEVEQPDFLNAVVCGFFEGEPRELLSFCHALEAEFGRDRSGEMRFGPRTVDIDLLLFGDRSMKSTELTIPHPRMHERAFVLVPLLDLDANLRDPRSGERYADVLSRIGRAGIYYERSAQVYSQSRRHGLQDTDGRE